jgi:hypothetical protein
MFAGTKADCLPETLWKDLTNSQESWDKKGLKRLEQLREIQQRRWEIRKLELALERMDRIEKEERERERKKCGAGGKKWFSALGEVFRWSAQLEEEEELEAAQVSRVTENANGESRSKLVCTTHDSSDDGRFVVVGQLEKELELVGEEVGSVEIKNCETVTLSQDDRVQNWIESITDATVKPKVWIPPTPRSPPSPSLYSQDEVQDDSIDITEVYTEGRRPHFVDKRPNLPGSWISGSSACSGDEKLPISTGSVGEASSPVMQPGFVVVARRETLNLISPVTSQQWHDTKEVSEPNSQRRRPLMPSFINGSKSEHAQDEDIVYDDENDYSDSEIAYEPPDKYSDSETVGSEASRQSSLLFPERL